MGPYRDAPAPQGPRVARRVLVVRIAHPPPRSPSPGAAKGLARDVLVVGAIAAIAGQALIGLLGLAVLVAALAF